MIGGAAMFQRVLVPLDGSSLTDHLLRYASGFARAFDAQVTLLRAYNWTERFALVDAPVIEVATGAERKEAAEARLFLEERARDLRREGLLVETVVLDAPPAQAILGEATRKPATLVVIGTRERRWLTRLLRGGTLHEVLKDFNVPVLVIHEPA